MAVISSLDILTVAGVLGASGTDLVTICTSGNINMYSKYKPVEYNSLAELTAAQWKSTGYGIKADSVDISYPSGGQNATILQNAIDGDFGWSYTGVDNSKYPLRLSDFRGYNHACYNPFYLEAVETNLKAQVNVGCILPASLPENNITASDLTAIAGLDSAERVGYGLLYQRGSEEVKAIQDITDSGEPLYPIVDSNGNIKSYTIDIGTYTGVYKVAAYLISTFQSSYYLLPSAAVTCNVYTINKISQILLNVDTTATKLKISYSVIGNDAYLKGSTTIPAGTMTLRVYKNSTDISPELMETINVAQLSTSNTSYDGTVSFDASREDYTYIKATYLDCEDTFSWTNDK